MFGSGTRKNVAGNATAMPQEASLPSQQASEERKIDTKQGNATGGTNMTRLVLAKMLQAALETLQVEQLYLIANTQRKMPALMA